MKRMNCSLLKSIMTLAPKYLKVAFYKQKKFASLLTRVANLRKIAT